MATRKILIIGVASHYGLEASYGSAAVQRGFDVQYFDVEASVAKYVKLSRFGQTLHRFLPVRAWTQKLNREMVLVARDLKPSFILYFTTAPVLCGTLATMRAILPQTKIIWIWPDTPLNLAEHNIASARLVDLTATYSSSTITSFERLGFHNVKWVPLAADPDMHGNAVPDGDNFACDISFVGGWRPEREKVMKLLTTTFPRCSIEIHGPLWRQNCREPQLRGPIKSDGILGVPMGKFFNRSRININRIDDTNYPAANMRFFEIPIAGALQLSSPCPEMSDKFVRDEHVLSFSNDEDLLDNVRWVMNNPEGAQAIRRAGRELTLRNHTYAHRLDGIFESLG